MRQGDTITEIILKIKKANQTHLTQIEINDTLSIFFYSLNISIIWTIFYRCKYLNSTFSNTFPQNKKICILR